MAFGKSRLSNPQAARLELFLPQKSDRSVGSARVAESERIRAQLMDTCHALQRVANRIVKTWIRWHDEHQTAMLMRLRRVALEKYTTVQCNRAMLMALRESAPAANPPELLALMLREASAMHPKIHGATLLGTLNWLAQTIGAQKSPKTNAPRWLRVLDGAESHWRFFDPLPIRLWSGNAKLVRAPTGLAVQVRLERIEVPGRKHAVSVPVELPIMRPHASSSRCTGHRLNYAAAAEIADGRRKLAQSQVFFADGKWWLSLTIDGPAPDSRSTRDRDRVVIVRPGRMEAIWVRSPGLSGGYAGEMLDRVSRCRQKLDAHRASIAARLGKIPPHVADQIAARWRDHTTGVCKQIVADLARVLAGDPCGKVIWLDGNHRTAALALAGKSGARDNRELFPFERLRAMATRSLERLGIEVLGRANLRSTKRRIAKSRAVAAKGGKTRKKTAAARESAPGLFRGNDLRGRR